MSEVQKACGNCKHRGNDPVDVYRYDPDTLEEILSMSYYECKRVAHGNQKSPGYEPGQKALAVDGSGYWARLVVENDFCCKLWEAK